MGRKKKIKAAEPEKINTETANTAVSQKIQYTGKVTISLQHGNKTISKRIYHNKGTADLFEFLCNCLGGNYNYGYRPCRIQLFTLGDSSDTPASPQIVDNTKISNLIYYNTTPKVDTSDTSCTTTFHFRIPFSVITDNDTGIYKMALYNGLTNISTNKYYAYYVFTDNTGTGWLPITLDESQKQFRRSYALVIDWALELSNPSIS